MTLPPLTANDFSAFFSELWDGKYDPFPWQRELARRMCVRKAPDFIAVPTGSGKTACLDAAIFALAVQAASPMAERTQGRRIFFIVNRRVIVDEAYIRAGTLCKKLQDASPESVVGRVAVALRNLCGGTEATPLMRVQLRGGIYRDHSWAGSLLQPMIVCSTVDQAGSRLLFRGYGVRPQARPIHAALVAQDSLLIVDEAHISQPFIQTLEWVARYRRHEFAGGNTVTLPFQMIQMTATPPAVTGDEQKITLSHADHDHPVLQPRLRRAKPARLVIEPKAKGKAREEQMAKRLAEEAGVILSEDVRHRPRSLAIMVNRVATARSVAEKMETEHKGRVTLLIGRLRPLDRETITKEIQNRLKTGAATDSPADRPLIVVSTQCLEVGADLDFDALVTEAASLDALRQRFGRLNRAGRDIAARGVVVLPGDQDVATDKLDENAPRDPIYGNSIPRTWYWLTTLATNNLVDFGINAMTTAVDTLRATGGDGALATMLSPTADAPILLPAYLDCWVQTNPEPAADPDVALFLHGPQQKMAEVQVCWRGDLPETGGETEWSDILSLCPPTAVECLPVPLHVFRDWLSSRGRFVDSSGDVAEIHETLERNAADEERRVPAFIWRGPDDRSFVHHVSDLRPGDTIVLRVQHGGWQVLGHLPNAPTDPQIEPTTSLTPAEVRRVDVAERAAASIRRRAVLRIHPALWPTPATKTAVAKLLEMAQDFEKDWRGSEIKELLCRILSEENSSGTLSAEQIEAIKHLSEKVRLAAPESYPGNQGFFLSSRDLLPSADSDEAGDSDPDALLEAAEPQELCNHTEDVVERVKNTLALLPLDAWRDTLIASAEIHDWGKIDPRFQALLRGTTPFVAMASEKILAKSGSITSSAAARRAARLRAKLPEGFRHEMLSVLLAEKSADLDTLSTHSNLRSLALHLIATHHGYARPFAPVVDDETPPNVRLQINGESIAITEVERTTHPAYAIDSGFADRFWQMNRHCGWWGIALLESVLRLADQAASANPQSSSIS